MSTLRWIPYALGGIKDRSQQLSNTLLYHQHLISSVGEMNRVEQSSVSAATPKNIYPKYVFTVNFNSMLLQS